MDNQCCAIEACCGKDPEKIRYAFANILVAALGITEALAMSIACAVLNRFALAPPSFTAVVQELTHGHAHESEHELMHILKSLEIRDDEASEIRGAILGTFALAPRSFVAVVHSIAAMVREHPQYD